MKPALFFIAGWLCFAGSLSAEEDIAWPKGLRAAFYVEMNLYKPTPSLPPAANETANMFADKRLPGAGCCISK